MLRGAALSNPPERWTPGDIATLKWRTGDVAGEQVQQPAITPERDLEAVLRAEHDRELEAARVTALEEGRLAGVAAERARAERIVTAAETAIDSIHRSEARWQDCVAENIAALAVAVARHVVGREIRSDPSGVADLVRRALTEFPIDQPMRVRVNPEDLALLSAPRAGGGDEVSIAPNRDVRWMADSRIQPGGCVVEGRERIIDGRVDTALERLYRQLSATNA